MTRFILVALLLAFGAREGAKALDTFHAAEVAIQAGR